MDFHKTVVASWSIVCFFGLVFSSPSYATAITFTYNCTISGTGSGTNNCSVGDTVAEVRITDTDANSDTVMDLFVEARWLDNDGTETATNKNYNLNTIWLNVIETDNLLGQNGHLNWVDASKSFNSLLFSTDADMATLDDNLIIKIIDDAVDDSNYKGFDTQLCGSKNINGGFGGNDSCGDISLVTATAGQWISVFRQ